MHFEISVSDDAFHLFPPFPTADNGELCLEKEARTFC
jgi:hypothetical protein